MVQYSKYREETAWALWNKQRQKGGWEQSWRLVGYRGQFLCRNDVKPEPWIGTDSGIDTYVQMSCVCFL